MKRGTMSGDSSLLKSINKSTLLKLIKLHAPISRAELAKRTKLTRATVSALVEELMSEHWVVETGIGESSGGRKPMMLEIHHKAGHIIGVDLRSTNMLVLVTDMCGAVIRKTWYPYEQGESAEGTLRQLLSILKQERAALPASPLGLLGVGIGIHGFVEYPSSRILFVPHTGWKKLNWKDAIEEQLGIPVIIDNEANLAALGELEFGAAADCSNMLYLSVAGGIGAGLVLQGELFRGNNGYAGEIGHTTMELNGRPCSCGNQGCWETYASERAIANDLHVEYAPGFTERILDRLNKGDAETISVVRKAGLHLGVGIGNMMHTLNPQMIVIGNAMGQYAPWINESIHESLDSRFSYLSSFSVRVAYSRLGEDCCALGAVSAVIREKMIG
ncbi:ROK family protein [Paenibacillus sp. OAS669]|uniref:ROK family protein n=1 Tax=Paenibacillus sp. OAS669 TaxID=2663821 RepID=UPI00178BD7B9|nr:ROK family transcriptional regulator [Paenibacillus sp. OAS669]MBE1441075.1 putative NBD/HSP70 family sugar kinase [Paenibacillus sp. OAS669]